ncbi:unnamed protein product [Urochloa humidicola]
MCKLEDKEVQKYSCLACGRNLVGTSAPSVLITHHIKDENTNRRCPSLTMYMSNLLATIEDREEHSFKYIDPGYVVHPTSAMSVAEFKRKGKYCAESLAESNELEPSSKVKKLKTAPVLIDPRSGMSILNSIQSGNLLIATKAATLESEAGSVLEDLFLGQEEAITDIVTMFISSRRSGALLNGHDVFLKIDSLLSVIRDAYPLLTVVPGDVSKLVLEQDQSICKLRRSFLNAAVPAVSDHSHSQPVEVSPAIMMAPNNASKLSDVMFDDSSSQQSANISNTVVSGADGS